jgi:hypothetical protein
MGTVLGELTLPHVSLEEWAENPPISELKGVPLEKVITRCLNPVENVSFLEIIRLLNEKEQLLVNYVVDAYKPEDAMINSFDSKSMSWDRFQHNCCVIFKITPVECETFRPFLDEQGIVELDSWIKFSQYFSPFAAQELDPKFKFSDETILISDVIAAVNQP